MQINATLLSLYSSGSSTSAADALVSLAQGRVGAAASVAQLDPVAVLKDAEKNGAKQITAKANEAQIRREIEDFTKGLAKAKTVDDLLNDPKAMKNTQ